MKFFRKTTKVKPIYFLFFCLLLCISTYAEETEYTVVGRVIGENSQPLSKIDIRLFPKSASSLTYGILTDKEGRFSIKAKAEKDDTWYLYVSSGSTTGRTFIDPPFYHVNRINENFIGQPIKFRNKKVINVGDVNVQFWFADVILKFQKNSQKLTEEEWKALWLVLKDDQERTLWEESIGPTLDKEIDLENSTLRIALPEGKWRIDFQPFDDAETKIHPEIIGQTQYFTIDKDSEAKIVDVVISN